MLTKRLVHLSGSLYERETGPSFVLEDKVVLPAQYLINLRHYKTKLWNYPGYSSIETNSLD